MENQSISTFPGPASTANSDLKITRKKRVLIVDDEESNIELLSRYLIKEGYDVVGAFNGQEALDSTSLSLPDLVLIDMKMPVMDGLIFCQKIRADFMARSLPIILLSAYNTLEDRLRGLRVGVDDYIGKPFNLEEVKARMENVLSRRRWDLASHSLTHLPGSLVIEEEAWSRMSRTEAFAFAYIDIDHFKAYNDVYGYESGDKVIKSLATLLVNAAKSEPTANAFAGHIGGDDFIFLSAIAPMHALMTQIAQQFDAERTRFYNAQDLERGFIQTKNRQGEEHKFPLLSLSAAIISSATRRLVHYARLVEIVSELKRFVKSQPHEGKSLVMWDRRTDAPWEKK